jgi:hypothetical protein
MTASLKWALVTSQACAPIVNAISTAGVHLVADRFVRPIGSRINGGDGVGGRVDLVQREHGDGGAMADGDPLAGGRPKLLKLRPAPLLGP